MLNIKIIKNLYRNYELVNIMLEEFSNPTLLVEQVNQDNFTYKMCKKYINRQIVE